MDLKVLDKIKSQPVKVKQNDCDETKVLFKP